VDCKSVVDRLNTINSSNKLSTNRATTATRTLGAPSAPLLNKVKCPNRIKRWDDAYGDDDDAEATRLCW